MTIRISIRLTMIAMLGAAALCAATAPSAAIWCANYSNGSTNCGFYTFDQCRAAISGVGGSCSGSDSGRSAERPAARKERKVEPKARKEPKEKEVKEKEQPRPAVVQPPPPLPPEQPAPSTFQSARALIAAGQYEAGIAAMKSLGYDDHPDIASAIGFANAQLGRYAEARRWYDRALAADPNHLTTLNYSGALHVAQGEVDKARGDLARIQTVCGNSDCGEYKQLQRLIAAKTR